MLKKKKTSVLHLNLNKDRYIFISDIHGDLNLLKMALQEANFNSNDALFLIGDIIEKGYQNLAILDYLMELRNHYEIYFLAGNCDEVLRYITLPVQREHFIYYAKKGKSIINEMADILNIEITPDMDVDKTCTLFSEHFKKYYDFIDSFYDVIILNDEYVLVHGGLDSLSEIPEYNDNILKGDSFYLKASPKPYYRIVGHFPVVNYARTIPSNNPIIDHDKKVICIDGGHHVKPTGQLNVLFLHNDMFSYFYVDNYPKLVCKKDIEDINTKVIHIDSYLEEVSYYGEVIGDFHKVYSEDHTLAYAYKTNVIDQHDRFFCYDATNYFMPLKKGERYSLIVKAHPFSIVKREGYVGLVDTKLIDNDEL